MNKSLIILVILYGIFSVTCNQSQVEFVTNYKASKSFEIQAYWTLKGKRKFIMGNNLSLNNRDSTFILHTCGCLSKGTWNILKDTVFLDYQEVNKQNDSIINCYIPGYYTIWLEDKLIGENKNEYIEVLKK